MSLLGAWKLHLLELSGSKSRRTTSLQNFRVWKVGKNKYLQGRTRNSVREKCGKWQNWEILPYLKIPKKISDRFSLKNVYVSVLVFSVNSENLNIGCTARFGEIKQEKIVIATSGEKTIAHACSGKTPGSSVRALQLVSTCCLRVQTFGTKSQLCKAFKAVRERQPLDNTFFFSYQAQTQSSYCKHSSETYLEYQEIFPRAAILFLCSRDFLSWLA